MVAPVSICPRIDVPGYSSCFDIRFVGINFMRAFFANVPCCPKSTSVSMLSTAVASGLSLSNMFDCLSSSSIISCVLCIADKDVWDSAGNICMLLILCVSSGSVVVLIGFGFHGFGFPLIENPGWCCP